MIAMDQNQARLGEVLSHGGSSKKSTGLDHKQKVAANDWVADQPAVHSRVSPDAGRGAGYCPDCPPMFGYPESGDLFQ
jgi:hypothetical protein